MRANISPQITKVEFIIYLLITNKNRSVSFYVSINLSFKFHNKTIWELDLSELFSYADSPLEEPLNICNASGGYGKNGVLYGF